MDFRTIANAMSNFSSDNKLGECGFGPVYKGTLMGGQDIAVKRLSVNSGQNEVNTIAKLQYRNLVKLLGSCLEEEEKMLVYEYLPNKSLDFFIFDQTRSKLLNWQKRIHIICGIARWLLYIQQDSRMRIIHRDLKASNVLLDNDMNPKISDVFSFGVLVLEIVSGKKNRGFSDPEHQLNLLGHNWRLWVEKRHLHLIDDSFRDMPDASEVLRMHTYWSVICATKSRRQARHVI